MKLNPQLLRLNRNLIACCVISALISAFVAQTLSEEENYLNTTITIVAGYAVFFGFFGCLFYLDNKKRYQAMRFLFSLKSCGFSFIRAFSVSSN